MTGWSEKINKIKSAIYMASQGKNIPKKDCQRYVKWLNDYQKHGLKGEAMNKQELIDKAVEALSGKMPAGSGYVITTQENFRPSDKNLIGTFLPVNHTLCGIGEDSPYMLSAGYWKLACSREEFTTRAKELGWINGYQWGKEYPTNGEKPNLPDDVKIKGLYGGEWSKSQKISSLGWDFDNGHYALIEKFIITDERYNPKPESVTDKLKATDKPYQLTEKDLTDWVKSELEKPNPFDDNSWHERGELPPVGWHGEVTWGAKVEWYECVILPRGRVARADRLGEWCALPISEHESIEFRPIKTERERFVDTVLKITDDEVLANELYKSGLFTLKETK